MKGAIPIAARLAAGLYLPSTQQEASMTITRRAAVTLLAALPLAACAAPATKESTMYGLIGKMRAQPGQRDALIAILLEGTAAMPGCLGYVIAKDKLDVDALWITETWDSQASHKASLALPAVQAAR
jgi:quinol monooxygenase YgiN